VSNIVTLSALVLALGAADRPAAPAKNAAVARIAAVERDLCLAGCPPVPAAATSDWLRSTEGQRAAGCQMACRTDQPAAALYRELAELSLRSALTADQPLVKLAGKEGPELAKKIQAAVKDSEGRKLGPLCARVRESFGTRDETAYLECFGRPGQADARARSPDPARAVRCAYVYAERDLDWLKRCPVLEARTDPAACAARLEELAAAQRKTAPNARAGCESDALGWLASSFRRNP